MTEDGSLWRWNVGRGEREGERGSLSSLGMYSILPITKRINLTSAKGFFSCRCCEREREREREREKERAREREREREKGRIFIDRGPQMFRRSPRKPKPKESTCDEAKEARAVKV